MASPAAGAALDAKKMQASCEHLQAREAVMREKEEDLAKMVRSTSPVTTVAFCRHGVTVVATAPSVCVRAVAQRENWDKMVASTASGDSRLAAALADLAMQQKLNKKLTGQVKDKETRVRALEAELESARAAAGQGSPCTINNLVLCCEACRAV